MSSLNEVSTAKLRYRVVVRVEGINQITIKTPNP
jgi:hypothetical protein